MAGADAARRGAVDRRRRVGVSASARPKQFSELGGARLVDHAVAAASAACDAVVVVVPDAVEWDGRRRRRASSTGGATRSDSVRAGLAAVPDDAEVVVVHDAARPLATADAVRAR